MKRLLILTAGVCAVFSGCATTGKAMKLADVSPIGIVSVMSNADIGWYGEDQNNGSLLGSAIGKAVNDKKNEGVSTLLSRADTLVGDAEKILVTSLAGSGVQVVKSETILNSDVYLAAKEDTLTKMAGFIVPAGYRILSSKDSDITKSLAAKTGLKAGLYVMYDFSKTMNTGIGKTGTAAAQVRMTVTLVNDLGKVVTQRSYIASSKNTFAVVGGVYDPAKMLALFPEAIVAVSDKFSAEFVK